jgi:arylsulfatase A-like enzyme
VLTGHALDWLKRHQAQEPDTPFFLYLSHKAVHAEFEPAQRHRGHYEDRPIPYPATMAESETRGKPDWVRAQRNSWHGVDYMYHGEFDFETFYRKYLETLLSVDESVSRVLDYLKENGLDKNTIIVIWGDHGWHLGDDLVWGKHTIFEWSLRSALLVKTPDMQRGFTCERVVSATDIYPTLMELCRVNSPVATDGASFAQLLTAPGAAPDWRDLAYSYFRQGITVRTPRYRLTKYFRAEEPTVELYDHQADPYENRNIAAEQPALVKELMKQWEKGNTGVFGQ